MRVTGQVNLDRYIDAGMFAAEALANGMVAGMEGGKAAVLPAPEDAVKRALAIDPPSIQSLVPADIQGFQQLAERLYEVFASLGSDDLDHAAGLVNELLRESPATPHLMKEGGTWRLHHHPADAPVLPMWRAICADSIARLIGAQAGHRLGICNASRCDRVFVDTTKNATRRYCSTACQNRAKIAAFRSRGKANESER